MLEPDKVLAEDDPTATGLFEKYNRIRMPNLGLGSEDVAAVLSYLEAHGAAAPESQSKNQAAAR